MLVDERVIEPRAEIAPTIGAMIGTHHHPPPAVKTPEPQPATNVKSRGPKSRAGLIA
jgi:hypothetical protein